MVQDTTFFSRLTHRLMWALAAVLITLAVVFSLARILLPNVDSYRHHVESMASELIGLPVTIEAMDARLLGLDPTIILKGVELKDEQGQKKLAQLQEAHVTLNLIETLRLRQPTISELGVVGIDLTVERHSDGSIAIQGLSLKDKPASPDSSGNDLTAWIMAQGHLSLRDSRVTWRDQSRKGRAWSFDSVNIELQNSADRHQLNAEIVLPRGMGSSLGLYADLKGDITKPRGWEGRFYLEAGGVQPAPWLDGVEFAGVQYKQGRVDINLWAEWSDAELQNVTGELALTRFRLARGQQAEVSLDRLATNLAWMREDKGWVLKLADLYLEKGGDGWQPSHITISHSDEYDRIMASYLRLDELGELAQLLPMVKSEQLKMLRELAPRGLVWGLRAEQSRQAPWHVQASLDRVGIQAWEKIPGIQDLSGRAIWQDQQAYLRLESRGTELNIPRLFRNTLSLNTLDGDVWLQREQEGWTVSMPRGHVANQDLALDLSMEMRLPGKGGKPFLELYGNYSNVNAASAPRYFPARIMPPASLAWLDQAFVQGQVPRGGLIVHGNLAEFPFKQGQGRFEVGFDTRQLELAFLEGWPHFKQVEARVVFLGPGLDIQARSGRLFNAELKPTAIRIPVLRRAALEIEGEASVADQDVLRLLTDTPLNKPIGRYLGDMQHVGDTRLQLKIYAPLSKKIADRSLRLDGVLSMQDSQLEVYKGLRFEAIKGQLVFDEQSLASEQLDARLLGRPVSGYIETRQEGEHRQTIINARGGFAGESLSRFFEHPIAEGIRGESDWQGRLIIGHQGDGSTPGTSLQIDSDMVGMAVDLPRPLGKPAERQRYMVLTHHFSGPQQGLTRFRYGLQADVLLQLRERQGRLHLQRGNIHFGKQEAEFPKRDVLKISGQLRNVELRSWAELVRRKRTERGADTPFLDIPLLIAMDQLHLQLDEDKEPTPGVKSRGTALSMASLPPLQVRIKAFGFNKTALQRLAFNTRSVSDTFLIEDFLLTGPSMRLSGQGRSTLAAQRPMTQLKLQLKSDNMGAMFKHLDYKSVIQGGETQVDASFNWPGSLMDFEVSELGGEMKLRIEEGRIEDLDPGAGGRLLGLLSIQALPRRLVLDFGDMFESGLSFDSISGDVRFKKGDAFTSNTTLESPSAKVIVTGRTGLAAEDFDQVINVIPNVSDTVPVAGALAWGPQVGAALLLLKKVLFSGLDEAAMFQYTVTGSWEQPVIKQVVQEGAEEEEEALFE